jgi:hypothetical protein
VGELTAAAFARRKVVRPETTEIVRGYQTIEGSPPEQPAAQPNMPQPGAGTLRPCRSL